ncbi:hypothetical protein [Halorubrum depositum]|uniref:hypothetical protein n=1 Tax=Halorubrum depositum TaxID=2583992 RepID=UPI0011A3312D|nr:hypothetical protein [Halorubrum depositum]
MRSNGVRLSGDASTPPRGPPPTVRGTVLLLAVMAGVLVIASYPVPSVGLAAVALSARYGGRPLLRRLRERAADWEPGPVCVPGTDVCLGA